MVNCISKQKNEKKSHFVSKKSTVYEYKYPTPYVISLQKLMNFAFKQFLEKPAKKTIIMDENGKKYYDLTMYTQLKWVYRTVLWTGWILNTIPKKLLNSTFKTFLKQKFDFSKFLMSSLPHQRFKRPVSMIIVPDSKENEIKTSEGKIVLPHLLVIEMLKRVCAYDPEHSIAQGYYCVCRKTRNCKNFPQDLGCLIVGPGASDVVERGIGRYISLENAIKHIENEVIPRRLSSFISIFPSDLHHFWGVKTHHSKFSFEVCFCCPCCCVLKRPHFFVPNDPIEDKEPFVDVRGFRAKRNLEKCDGCGKCIESCPLKRIKLINVITKDRKIVKKATTENCMGCGNCVPYCPNKAIEMVATESFDKLEDLLGIFEYYDLKKEDFLKSLNEKYQKINKRL